MVRGLSPTDLLWIWEHGLSRHSVDRGLLILRAADPERSDDDLFALPLGQREAELLSVRAVTTGDRLDVCAACPSCGVEMEFAAETGDLLGPARAESPREPFEATVDGYRLRLRCPDNRDMAEAAQQPDVTAARQRLLKRTVLAASKNDRAVPLGTLPPHVVAEAAECIGRRDPQAETSFELSCPDCGHRWPTVLDMASFMWDEIAAQARRLLEEVHVLARAYGWRESDILAMSPLRRQSYLQLAG